MWAAGLSMLARRAIGRDTASVASGGGGDLQTIVCLVDTARPQRSVQFPLTREQMRNHDDWTLVENWSRDAYLQSKSADSFYKLGSRFGKAFPTQWQGFFPLELESFEFDGVSAPTSFVDIGVRGRNVKKHKGKTGLARAPTIAQLAAAAAPLVYGHVWSTIPEVAIPPAPPGVGGRVAAPPPP